MQTTIRFLDDVAKVGASFIGLAFGAKDEIKTRVKAKADSVGRNLDFVSRDEFETVRLMAIRAREENAELSKKVTDLETKLKT